MQPIKFPARFFVSHFLALIVNLAYAGDTTRVSIGSNGAQGHVEFAAPSTIISADGRYVAFDSRADNLVAGDTNQERDAFVHDRLTGSTSRISVSSSGLEGNYESVPTAMSANGRYIAFFSLANNLVINDTNEVGDAFVHDQLTGKTTRVSVSSVGGQADQASYPVAVSANARYVALNSEASNLDHQPITDPLAINCSLDNSFISSANPQLTFFNGFIHDRLNGKTTCVTRGFFSSYITGMSADGRFVVFESGDYNPPFYPGIGVFLHDRQTGTTTRVSVNSKGEQANGWSSAGPISSDGRYVAFSSYADNLVPGDTDGIVDTFVHDRLSGQTSRVSIGNSGEVGNGDSVPSAISADGRFIVLTSKASNLVTADENGVSDVFIHDRLIGSNELISIDSDSIQGNIDSGIGNFIFYHDGAVSISMPSMGAISADGRYVAFWSWADNLVTGDSNGVTDVFVRNRLLNNKSNADLKLKTIAKPSSIKKGQIAQFVFRVKNKGPNPVNNVLLTHFFSKGTGKVVGAKSNQGKCSPSAISVCNLGFLAANESVKINFRIKVQSNQITQQASVNAAPKDVIASNNTVKVTSVVTP